MVVQMEGQKTLIQNPEKGKSHDFTYDRSFWSYSTEDAHFASQEYVFEQIGRPLLNRSLEGYNTCLFAYGQTGSGKSYTYV